MAKNLPLKYQGFPLAGNVRLELPAQNARLQKQREFLQQRRGGKEKPASYWGLSEIHRRLFHIVPTAPAPDGGDFFAAYRRHWLLAAYPQYQFVVWQVNPKTG